MKKTLLSSLLLIPALAFGWYDYGPSGTRAEFFNEAGERIGSDYVQYGYMIFRTDKDRNGEAQPVCYPSGIPFVRSRFIPWGAESYTLTIGPCTDGTQLSVITEDGTELGFSAEKRELTLRCGTEYTLLIKTPDGGQPAVSEILAYTRHDYLQDTDDPFIISSSFVGTVTDPVDIYSWNTYRRLEALDFLSGNDGAIIPEDENVYRVELYMENEPVVITATSTVPDAALLQEGVRTVVREMYFPHEESPVYNGEPYLQQFLGEGLGDASSLPLPLRIYGGEYCRMENLDKADSWPAYFAWFYPWLIIDRANYLIALLPLFKNVDSRDVEIARAQMLTMRSYAYLRLLQTFGVRWEDSDNGEAKVCPIPTDFRDDTLPLESMKDVVARCREDLDKAIAIFDNVGYRSDTPDLPDAAVARGILTRIALLCHDWATAEKASGAILADNPLTTNGQLHSGFILPSDSWLWGISNQVKTRGEGDFSLGYVTLQQWTANNGVYPSAEGFAPAGCDLGVYRALADDDTRTSLFLGWRNIDPSKGSDFGIDYWFNQNRFDPSTLLLKSGRTELLDAAAISVPEGLSHPFMSEEGETPISIATNVKFWAPENIDDEAWVPLMRTEEMLLSRAEALCHLDREQEARELLTQLGRIRRSDPSYTCTADSEALMEAIRLERRAELWGEGFSFFDRKRWNMPLVREQWKAGDTASGNHPSETAGTVATDAANGWRLVIPVEAVRDNSDIDITAMGYKTSSGYSKAPAKLPKDRDCRNPKTAVTLHREKSGSDSIVKRTRDLFSVSESGLGFFKKMR